MKKQLLILLLFITSFAFAQSSEAPKVLIVTAHPDDDAACAGTVYKITHDLKGKVDLLLITNGEGGYKYSTLAEDYYGIELTEEALGREYLPAIRKKELMAGGKIVGVRNYFFLDQKDNKYTLDMTDIVASVWDTSYIKKRMSRIIKDGGYDYIFCLLPVPQTHAHHKTASLMALVTVSEMNGKKPIVLGMSSSSKNDTAKTNFKILEGYPLTKINSSAPLFSFDRTQPFGFKNVLNYKIIVNWLIAEHKSQGTMQLLMNQGDYENFWYFDINPKDKISEVQDLFNKLSVNHFKKKFYNE